MIHQAHGRTIALIRHLRAMPIHSPTPRRGRIPRQQQPDRIRLEYFRAIKPVCDVAYEVFSGVKDEILHELIQLRREQGKKDHYDTDRGKRAAQLVERAARTAADKLNPSALHAVAAKFGKQTTDHQKEQLDRQVRAAVGVSYASIEKPVRDKVEGFAALNVELIKTVPERFFDRLRLDVQQAFEGGEHPDTLAERFAREGEDARYEIALNDARRIARDQIGKLNAEVNQERQEGMGVSQFVWRTMNDGRVRDEHEELEGEIFEWESPPAEGAPGEPIQCRCYAEPVFDQILESIGN